MRKTTIYPAYPATAPPLTTAEPVKPVPPPSVDRTQVTTPAWAALLAGCFATVSTYGVALPLVVWFARTGDPPNYDLIALLLFAPILIGLVAGGGTGVYVTLTAAHYLRPRPAPTPLPPPAPVEINIPPAPEASANEQPETAPVSREVAELFVAGLNVLALHYNDGKAATRPECEQIGINQDVWGNVNRILRTMQIKAERSWGDVSYQRARALWLQCWWSTADLESDRPYISVPSPTGNGFTRVDLTVNQP